MEQLVLEIVKVTINFPVGLLCKLTVVSIQKQFCLILGNSYLTSLNRQILVTLCISKMVNLVFHFVVWCSHSRLLNSLTEYMPFSLSRFQHWPRFYPESPDADWFLDRVLQLSRELPQRLQMVISPRINMAVLAVRSIKLTSLNQ